MIDEIRLMRTSELARYIQGSTITPAMAEVMAHLFVNADDKPRTYQERLIGEFADEVEKLPVVQTMAEHAARERAA